MSSINSDGKGNLIVSYLWRLKMYGELRALLKAYKNSNGKKILKRGDWKIAEGGYDLWFEVYYKDIPKIQCIDGELQIGNSEGIDADEALKIVREILAYVK